MAAAVRPRSGAGTAFSFGPMASFYQQSGREIRTGPDTLYDVGRFAGQSLAVAGSWTWPALVFGTSFFWRGTGIYRSLDMTGDSRLKEGLGPFDTRFRLSQKFLGFEGAILWRPGLQKGRYFLSAGGGIYQTLEVNLRVISGAAVEIQDLDRPLYVVVLGSTGYDIPLSGGLTLTPELRVGVIPLLDPVLLMVDALVALGWKM
jgi:hypothetical protein